jgi:membrane protein
MKRLWRHLRRLWLLTKQAGAAWWNNNAFRLAASLAFYTLFSISPLLVITVSVVDWFGEPILQELEDVAANEDDDKPALATRPGVNSAAEQAAKDTVPDAVEELAPAVVPASERIFKVLDEFIGPEAGRGLREIRTGIAESGGGELATLISVVTLLVGVTAIFAELQDALNLIFHVKPMDRLYGNAVWTLIRTRLLGFGVAVSAGFLLLVSLLVSVVVNVIVDQVGGAVPGSGGWLLSGANFTLSVVVTTLLFMLIYKLLPDVKVSWRDVALGALVTSLLFNIGKYAIGTYLGSFAVGSAYGAAGSFAVFLLWVYYSALICFFGAEFTAQVVRHRSEPEEHAEEVVGSDE